MSEKADDFFDGKRPWSVIKDEVLGSYMPVYLSKVKRLHKPILIVDGFAGPGVFEDGSTGSPLIICKSAEEHVKGSYQAFFINKERNHHEKLTSVLEQGKWLAAATPILGDTTKILPHLPKAIRDHTVFLYLDPFGPTGCPYSLLEPFLTRDAKHSTEIVLMMHMPIAHRLAARNAVNEGRENEPLVQKYHLTMTRIFGGDYWKKPMFDPTLSKEERETQLISAYESRLAQYLPYVGSCPVREGERKPIKYFIVFASRHPDAMLLMNDAMVKAYSRQMHHDAYAGTLFEKTSWNDQRSTQGLREAITNQVKRNPGLTRENLWLQIVQNNFMRFLEKEYRTTVQQLVELGELDCPTPRPTKRLNDKCQLFIPSK